MFWLRNRWLNKANKLILYFRSLLLLALIEIILVMYVYGFRRFLDNIKEMGLKIPAISKVYWLGNWMLITPAILATITIITWIKFTPASYGGYVFPAWVQVRLNKVVFKNILI